MGGQKFLIHRSTKANIGPKARASQNRVLLAERSAFRATAASNATGLARHAPQFASFMPTCCGPGRAALRLCAQNDGPTAPTDRLHFEKYETAHCGRRCDVGWRDLFVPPTPMADGQLRSQLRRSDIFVAPSAYDCQTSSVGAASALLSAITPRWGSDTDSGFIGSTEIPLLRSCVRTTAQQDHRESGPRPSRLSASPRGMNIGIALPTSTIPIVNQVHHARKLWTSIGVTPAGATWGIRRGLVAFGWLKRVVLTLLYWVSCSAV